MTFKKSGKTIFGVELNKSEEKVLQQEINKQISVHLRSHSLETVAIILWVLRKGFGFGEVRLRRFYDMYGPMIEELIRRYELDDADDVWITTRMLKEEGIDIEAWNKESSGNL